MEKSDFKRIEGNGRYFCNSIECRYSRHNEFHTLINNMYKHIYKDIWLCQDCYDKLKDNKPMGSYTIPEETLKILYFPIDAYKQKKDIIKLHRVILVKNLIYKIEVASKYTKKQLYKKLGIDKHHRKWYKKQFNKLDSTDIQIINSTKDSKVD